MKKRKENIDALGRDNSQFGIDCGEEGTLHTTLQSGKDDCDINLIMKRAALNGGELPVGDAVPRSMDCTMVGDFQEMANIVARSRNNFSMLPDVVQKKFNYSYDAFRDFGMNPDNAYELERMLMGSVPGKVEVTVNDSSPNKDESGTVKPPAGLPAGGPKAPAEGAAGGKDL